MKRWNQIDEEIKGKTTVNSFKGELKKKLNIQKHIHYLYGKDKWAMTHTSMRLELSLLNRHLHTYHIVPSPLCPHCEIPANTIHFLLKWPKYAASRVELFGLIGPTVDKLGIDRSYYNALNTLLLIKWTSSINIK